MASTTSSKPVDLPTPNLTLLPRDPWENQLQFLLLLFQAKQSLERTERAFQSNTDYSRDS